MLLESVVYAGLDDELADPYNNFTLFTLNDEVFIASSFDLPHIMGGIVTLNTNGSLKKNQ